MLHLLLILDNLDLMKLWLKWVWYCILTQSERTEYSQALWMGCDVYHSDATGTILPGDHIKFYYNRSKPPTRRYLNKKEFYQKYSKAP